MDKFEYLSGLPRSASFPRAPCRAPAPRAVRAGAWARRLHGKVAPTYHSPSEQLAPARPGRSMAGPSRPTGFHRSNPSAASIPRSMRRRPRAARRLPRMARLVANATVTMNVTGPRSPWTTFSSIIRPVRLLHQRGAGVLETTFGPSSTEGRFPDPAKGTLHPLRPRRAARSTTGCTRASRAIPRRARRRTADSSRTARATTSSRVPRHAQ